MIILKSQREIGYMRKSGRIVAETIETLKRAIEPGISTIELDKLAEDYIKKAGAIPAFKGYHGFPGSICTSINEEVVHGIPSKRTLEDGDIISIDVGAIYNGYVGDAAVTIPVGNVTDEATRLIEVTEQCFFKGLEFAKEGYRLSDISHAIQEFVESNGFSVVRDYAGHGIGQDMHEDPQIPNFGPPNRGPKLRNGMTLAIEPMVNAGKSHVMTKEDNWTVVTRDNSLSHYENIAITDNGLES